MRALIQRVSRAAVTVSGQPVGAIGAGICILVGVTHTDDGNIATRLADKVWHLRIFNDAEGIMNRSLAEQDRPAALCVSQFTLYADTRKGNRPSFTAAASPEVAEPLYERFCERLGAQRGRFGARMEVELTGDGPVTILVDS